jgi:hypothetical protein
MNLALTLEFRRCLELRGQACLELTEANIVQARCVDVIARDTTA